MRVFLWLIIWISAISVITYFAYHDTKDNIEDDIIVKVEKRYQSNKIKWAEVSLENENNELLNELDLSNLLLKRTIVLHGISPSKMELRKAKNLALDIDDVSNVSSRGVIIQRNRLKLPTVSPYTLTVSKNKLQNINIDGYTPSFTIKHKLLNKAKKLFPGYQITSNIKRAYGVPKDFYKVANIALEGLVDANEGTFEIIHENYTANIIVNKEEEKEKIKNKIEASLSQIKNFSGTLKFDFVQKNEIEDIDIFSGDEEDKQKENTDRSVISTSQKECQSFINSILSKKSILFAYKKTTLQNNKSSVLDTIIDKLKKCDITTKIIEIGGHTDSIGSRGYNQRLSEKRAKSVKNYMISKGIETKRVKAVGYGEVAPIASNNTKAGQAKNRRIEIKILEVK